MFCQVLLSFLLFGLIFLIVPTATSPYEAPKAYGAILLIGLLLLATLPQLLLQLSFKLPPRRWKAKILPILLPILLIILALYHLFFPTYSDNPLFGNPIRPQGTLLYISLFLLFLIAQKVSVNMLSFSKIAFLSLIGLFISTLIIGPRTSLRFIGPLGEANSLAAAVLFLFPLSFSSPNTKHQKISFFLAFLLTLLSGSRAGVLGLWAECLILFCRQRKLIWSAGFLLFIPVFVIATIIPFIPHPVSQQARQASIRFENRAEIWSSSYLAGFDYPLLGTGFGSTEEAIRKKAIETNNFIRHQPVDSAHNLLLNWWIMGGGIGLILFITIIAVSVINLYRQKSWSLLSILIGLLIIQSFNPVSSITLVHFWWTLGIAFSNLPTIRQNKLLTSSEEL